MPESPKRHPPRGHRRNLSTEVSETAHLDLVIPHASDLNIAEAVTAADQNTQGSATSNIPAVAHIEQRSHLFYDEKLPVFIVLQILVELSDELYEHYLARLAVSLEVSAIDGQRPQLSHSARSQESVHPLFQTVVDEKDTPRMVVGESTKRLTIWKIEIPLGHPRARLNNPRVILTCSATLRPAELQKPLFDDEYITSRQPLGVNLLESFLEDPLSSQAGPRLSAHRVSRVIPVTQGQQQSIRPLGYAAKRAFNVYPAINIRLRYSRIVSGGKQKIIASLDLEVTPYSECNVTITNVEISVGGGTIELLGDSSFTALPVTCRPRDDTTFLYSLSQAEPESEASSAMPVVSGSKVRPISVSVEAVALVSDVCHPQISTHWTTTVDFAAPPAQHFQKHGGIQRAHRPPSLGSIIHGATVQASSGIRPGYSPLPTASPNVVFTPPLDGRPISADGSSLGLTVTFTGPSRVFVGEVFTWSVFVVNRSNRTRKLALVVPQKRKKPFEGKALPSPPVGEPPEPVIDENMVLQMHRSKYLDPTELVPLVNDIRIGPLVPSACHTAELRFVPLATGLLSLEGVRVVDLNTNETTDCKDLPCIVSVAKKG